MKGQNRSFSVQSSLFEVIKVSLQSFFFLGKIRVFCRIRPASGTEAAQGGAVVVDKIDEYSVKVETPRGPREFQFDKVFCADASQEDLFHDTNRWGGWLLLKNRFW